MENIKRCVYLTRREEVEHDRYLNVSTCALNLGSSSSLEESRTFRCVLRKDDKKEPIKFVDYDKARGKINKTILELNGAICSRMKNKKKHSSMYYKYKTVDDGAVKRREINKKVKFSNPSSSRSSCSIPPSRSSITDHHENCICTA